MTKWETFGAVLAVVASVISNLGVNIQKYSHTSEARLPSKEQRPYIQRPVWWIGLSFVIIGSIGDFAAFGFATQSLVAGLGGGATLIANVVTAHLLNHEALHLTDLGGVLFVIIGVVLIALVSEPNVEYPLPELEKRFVRTEFVVYIVTVGVCAVSMLATIKGSVANRLKNQVYWSNRRQKQRMKQMEVRLAGIEQRLLAIEQKLDKKKHGSGPFSSKSPGHIITVDGNLVHTESRDGTAKGEYETIVPSRVPYYYAICSGIVGAVTVLLAKCSAIMIALSLKGDNQFKYGLTYVFIGGMFVCIFVQTHFLNMATSLGDIMTVFPIFQACWITFSVVGGAIFYETDDPVPVEDKILYPLAIASIGAGVALLVQHGKKNAANRSGKPGSGGNLKGGAGGEYGIMDDDDEICLVEDASMSSPLLPPGSREEDGYLHLDS